MIPRIMDALHAAGISPEGLLIDPELRAKIEDSMLALVNAGSKTAMLELAIAEDDIPAKQPSTVVLLSSVSVR